MAPQTPRAALTPGDRLRTALQHLAPGINLSSGLSSGLSGWLAGSLAGWLLCWTGAAPAFAGGATLTFSDQTAAAGLTATHTPPGGIATSPMLAGGGVGDFDRDGWLDLFVPMGGGAPDRLYMNNHNGTFTDQAAAWGVSYSHVGGGVAVGDYDGDGWLDIFVASHGTASHLGPGQHRLYHNNGRGAFTEVAVSAGVNQTSPTTEDGYGAAFGDIDGDGDLDLFVAGWVANSQGNRLFRNNGNGTFTDVTTSSFDFDIFKVHGFSPLFMDLNGDRLPELLLTGDFDTSKYLINNGDGTFHDATNSAGTGLDSNGMGQAVGDFNGDGRFDWYVTSILANAGGFSGNMLYLDQGGQHYLEGSVAAGVNDGGWGWGTVAVDFDHDLDVDILETNGWPGTEWGAEPSYLFLNDGTGVFTESAAAAQIVHTDLGRGLLHFDADNDGDQDVVIFAIGGPLRFFRNDLTGPGTNWLRVLLDSGGRAGVPPDGFGAQVHVHAAGRDLIRAVPQNASFLSASELAAHFGLGAAPSADSVRVNWPQGTTTYLRNVAANQTITVTCCPGFTALGNALPGSQGEPAISGMGTLLAGDPTTLTLFGARPSSPVLLALGQARVDLPFKGGVLVPRLDALLAPLATDATGMLHLAASWPVGVPSATTLYLQAWIIDAAGPAGYAASNALSLETP